MHRRHLASKKSQLRIDRMALWAWLNSNIIGLLVVIVVVVGLIYYFMPSFSSVPPVEIDRVVEQTKAKKDEPDYLSSPRLVIPNIHVSSFVQDVGTESDGSMSVPSNAEDVGWYKGGALPGSVGNAVITGHVDGGREPGVFRQLDQLDIGDFIYILTKDNKKLTFSVIDKVSYPVDDAPLEKIFGSADKKMLNLVTCDGIWNVLAWQYSNRLVVFTEFVDQVDI